MNPRKTQLEERRIVAVRRMLESEIARDLICQRLATLNACGRNGSAYQFILTCIQYANQHSYKAVSYAISEHTGWLTRDQEFEIANQAFRLHSRMGNIWAEMDCLRRMSTLYNQPSH